MRGWPLALLLLVASVAGASPDANKQGGGTGGVPGLSGTTGNEDTLEALYHLRGFKGIKDYKTFYFSADGAGSLPTGSDSNACTMEAPCQTIDKMKTIAASVCYAHFILDTDWWDTSAEWGTNPFIQAPTGCADSYNRPSIVISSISGDPLAPFHFSCEGLTDAQEALQVGTGIFFGAGVGASTSWIAVENFHTYRCPAEPFNATDARGADVFRGNTIALNGFCEENAGQNNQCFTNHDKDNSNVSVNVRWTARNPADFNSDCVGPTCGTHNDPENPDGTVCTAGVAGNPWSCCNGATPAVCDTSVGTQFLNLAPGKATIISNYTYSANRGVGASGFVIGGGGATDITVIGPTIDKLAANTFTGVSAFAIGWSDEVAVDTMNFRIAKTTISGFNDANDSGIFTQAISAFSRSNVNLEIYQTTFDSNTNQINQNGMFTGANGRIDWKGRCDMFDGETNSLFTMGTIADTDEIVNFDFTDSGFDDDSVANSFNFDTTASATVADFRAFCDDTGVAEGGNCRCQDRDADCTTGFFSGDSYEIAGSDFVSGTSACDKADTCFTTGCNSPYTVLLPGPEGYNVAGAAAYVGNIFFGGGTEIRSFRFNALGDGAMGGR